MLFSVLPMNKMHLSEFSFLSVFAFSLFLTHLNYTGTDWSLPTSKQTAQWFLRSSTAVSALQETTHNA